MGATRGLNWVSSRHDGDDESEAVFVSAGSIILFFFGMIERLLFHYIDTQSARA